MDLTCPCLHGVLLIGSRTRPFSPSATGNALPSYDLEISCLSAPQPFGPIRASRAMAGECFLKPDDIVFFVVAGVYVRVILSLCFYVIGWHWICVIQLVRSGTLAGMRGVTIAQDDVISPPMLSHQGSDRTQCSDWLLIASQWAELSAPPMSVHGHTVVSSREGERLFIRPVFDWCSPFVTGSLLVSPVRRQAAASSCGVVLGSPQVSAGVLLRAEDWFPGCFCGSACLRDGDWERSTGCGLPELGCPNPVTHSAVRRDYAHRSSTTWTRIVSRMC